MKRFLYALLFMAILAEGKTLIDAGNKILFALAAVRVMATAAGQVTIEPHRVRGCRDRMNIAADTFHYMLTVTVGFMTSQTQ